jgi:hypothetical protein
VAFYGGAFYGGNFFNVGPPSVPKRRRTIKRSELAQEEYEAQLRAAVVDMRLREFTPLEQAAYDLATTNDEDDELLLKIAALMVLH